MEFRQLTQWYRTLDQLEERKEHIERELYLRRRDLFSLEGDLVLCDLTSTYFEGQGPPLLGAHGSSRDGKPRNRQVLKDLEERFGLRRVVFVGDRGMVTSDNIALLRSRKQGDVVGLNRRRREKVYRSVERATGPWRECPLGIAARKEANPPRTYVQEVPSDEGGVRIFVVKSEAREGYERTQRLKAMERVRAQLEALSRRVEQDKLKAPDQIGAAAARTLARYHGYRHYDWELKDGRFRFFEHPVNLKREQAYFTGARAWTRNGDLYDLAADPNVNLNPPHVSIVFFRPLLGWDLPAAALIWVSIQAAAGALALVIIRRELQLPAHRMVWIIPLFIASSAVRHQ